MKRKRYIFLLTLLLALLWLFPTAGAEENPPFRTGDRLVIYAPEYHQALSSVVDRYYHTTEPIRWSEGVMEGYSDAAIWIAEDCGNGTWRFLQEGKALSMAEKNPQTLLGGLHDTWKLEPMDGGFALCNSCRSRYLCCYSGKGQWSTVKPGGSITAIHFYVIPEAMPEETEIPVSTGTPPSAEETPPADTMETTPATEETAPQEETVPPHPTEPECPYNLYFGQLHAHTDLSDGEGSVEEAFAYASSVENLDFLAITEHSQSFDNSEAGDLLTDGTTLSEKWARGKAAAREVTDEGFVGIFGFEMTWNQGQGHMNTFNTPGWLSRNQDAYQNYRDGMENYYAALLAAEGSVSQFNHPGTEYGDFKDFGCYSPELDQRISLIEVADDLEFYDRALEKGWHLAPANNQNNHCGKWGDESPVRTVILAEELTEQDLYAAMENRRVYATEDADLEIYYTLCGEIMGSVLPAHRVDTVLIEVQLRDPTDVSLGTVDVIGPEGTVLATRTVSASEEGVTISLEPEHSYYYLRITQPDGDVAVTAPVWLDPEGDMGIAFWKTETELTVTGEEQNLVLNLYNKEALPLSVDSVTVTDAQSGEVLCVAEDIGIVESMGALEWKFDHIFAEDGLRTLAVAVQGTYGESVRNFREETVITVLPKPAVDQILLDRSHGSEVPLETLTALGAKQGIRISGEKTITEQKLKTCRLLIIPAPEIPFEDAFVEAVEDYVRRGGNVILCGSSDAADTGDCHTASQFNKLLSAMGATMILHDDQAENTHSHGGSPELLYSTVFSDCVWMEPLTEGQVFAHLDGATVNPGEGQWLVKGLPGTESLDADEDGKAGWEDCVLLSVEKTAEGGHIFLSGSMFLSDESMGDLSENPWALPSANRTLGEIILGLTRTEQKLATIAQVRDAEPGRIYLVEGLVTAGTANPNNAFVDTIYIQDATGGILAQPYSTHGLELGRRVRILGELKSASGNLSLEIINLEILEKEDPITPKAVSNDALAAHPSRLVQLEGTVLSAEYTADGEGVSRFLLEDEEGSESPVVIDGNIRSGSRGKNELARLIQPGYRVKAVGLSHLIEEEAVLRIRDCDEVWLLWSPPEPEETTVPTTVPEETTIPVTEPEETTVPVPEPEETVVPTSVPEETTVPVTEPEETTAPEPTKPPADPDNPPTGDGGIGLYVVLMCLSFLTMAVLRKRI